MVITKEAFETLKRNVQHINSGGDHPVHGHPNMQGGAPHLEALNVKQGEELYGRFYGKKHP